MGRPGATDEKGFTLTHLLIIVAIIGMLAAIAYVYMVRSQRRARYAQAAADTRSIVRQTQVLTSDYHLTPVAGIGLAPGDPSFLWTRPRPVGLPQLPVYMPRVEDPWAAAGTNYRFTESAKVGPGCGPAATPGCVVFSAWTVGKDAKPDWDGLAAPAAMNDDLGNSSTQGCVFGPNTGITAPC